MLISADEAKINKDVHPPCHAVAQISTGKISEKVVTRSSIQAADLLHLIERNIAAVRIPGYYDVGLCGVVSKLLLANPHRGSYVNAPMIGRVGQAFFESQACETSQRRYTAMAVNWIRDMRASCAPYLSPIDKVRLELDETWLAGCNLASANNAKMFTGLTRIFAEGSEAEPHTDVFAWDAACLNDVPRITHQLALNVYLSVPHRGGELILWDFKPDRETYERCRNGASYGLRRDVLPDPDVTIVPEQGDLILFNPAYVHAVARIEAGERITSSSFIGYTDTSSPLQMWS